MKTDPVAEWKARRPGPDTARGRRKPHTGVRMIIRRLRAPPECADFGIGVSVFLF
jgi:hypothetical protein